MARLASALLLLAVATCSASQFRISGGSTTSIENYPSIVQVQNRVAPGLWLQSCAGGVITSKHVLTSARCFSGLLFHVTNRRIIAGSTHRNTGGIVRTIVRAFNHPTFDESRDNDGDISVILLETPLAFSNLIQAASIIGSGVAVPDNMAVVQAGWGLNTATFPNIRSTELQEVTVYTVNNAVCAENYANLPIPFTVTSNMICAGLPAGGAGACVGDGGGPLYVNDIIVGVISWGLGCTNATFPRVHTAVSSYTQWIVDTAV